MIWLAIFTALASTVLGQELEPKIFVDAKDFHGYPDSFRGLKVETNNGPGFKFQWYHNDKLIDDNYRLSYSHFTTRHFTVDSTSANINEYDGTYQFFMVTPVGNIAGRKVKVEFTYPGEFLGAKDEVTRDVVVGQANFITCPKHTKGSNSIYKWGKTTQSSGISFLAYSPRYIVLNNGTLFFSHLLEKDVADINNQDIKCGMEATVGNNNRFKWSTIVRMNKNGENLTSFGPKIVTTLPNRDILENDTISMKCAAAGRPVPKYSWKKIDDDGTEKTIDGKTDGMKFADGDTRVLVISSATKSNAGTYICTATIAGKSDSVRGYLRYREKPSWVGEKIKSVSPSIFSSHSWQCNATGSPVPTYSWFKNGIELPNNATHEISDGKITFPDLLKEDSGMYECVADNGFDNIYQTAYLDVQAFKPVFDTNTGKETLFLDNEGMIECKASAAPAAKNKWVKDGVEIDTSLPRYELRNENLVIKKVSKADVGNYTCTAENRYGNDVKKIQVEVVGEIKFIEEPKDVIVIRGNRFSLPCRAEGDRPVKYKWQFNGNKLKFTRDKIIWSSDTNILIFINPQVEESGDYECIAYIDQPSYAEKKRSARVLIRGPPEAPDNVKVNGDCNDFKAKVSWKSSTRRDYDLVKNFVIQMSNSYEDSVWRNYTDKVASNVREAEVRNLSPWAKYRFRVLAVNTVGISNASYPTKFGHCETPPKAPTVCPQLLRGVAGKAGELTIKWEKTKLIDQNGPDFNYHLKYKKTGDTIWKEQTLDALEVEFKVPDAGIYKKWEFQIQGVNGKGDSGPLCSSSARSGQDAPTTPKAPVVNGIGENAVRVVFQKGDSFSGTIEQFYVLYRIKGEEGEWEKTTTRYLTGDPNQHPIDVKGLNKSTEYEFATVAMNSAGKSKQSDIISAFPGVLTPTDTPSGAYESNPVYKKSWFVAVVVVVCFLLLLLLVLLLITRKRGERYPVGKREKKRAGILDDAEEADADSYPMKPPRSNGNGLKRHTSDHSMPYKDPDRDSLDEYAEDRFGEDAASFIGQYNDDKRPMTVEGPEYV